MAASVGDNDESCCTAKFDRCRALLAGRISTHSGQTAVSKAVSQPNSGFAKWSTDKRPLATSPDRPGGVIRLYGHADVQMSDPHQKTAIGPAKLNVGS